jgi:hypothetical protein
MNLSLMMGCRGNLSEKKVKRKKSGIQRIKETLVASKSKKLRAFSTKKPIPNKQIVKNGLVN